MYDNRQTSALHSVSLEERLCVRWLAVALQRHPVLLPPTATAATTEAALGIVPDTEEGDGAV